MCEMRILVVDDEPGMLEVCEEILRGMPAAQVTVESRSTVAAKLIATGGWDLLVTDLRMPEVDGIELLRIGRAHQPGLPVLILTAFPSVDTAVESMKLGASDYLTKPFLPEDLLAAAQRLLDGKRREEEHRVRRQAERGYTFGDMIGMSPRMQAVFDAIEQIAATDVDVLITGETGTGKELVARSVHQMSSRAKARFVPVDCGAIPEDLLESEFFGHERGAFTGAHTKNLGLLQFAHGGTFFLDELAQLPAKLQSKLLRALQERRVRRVGGTQEIEVNVRVLAATARDLEVEVRENRFRMDLFYRVNVAQIHLPPLREREGDIPLLVEHFTERYAREMDREPMAIDPAVLEILRCYPWPGNVRELQNVVKRAIAMSRSNGFSVSSLPENIVTAAVGEHDGGSPGYFQIRDQHLAAFEKAYLERVLRANLGNISQAAENARLPRGTFYRLLNRHSLNPAEFRE
jgi:DNA-binding NtrC family response regulator